MISDLYQRGAAGWQRGPGKRPCAERPTATLRQKVCLRTPYALPITRTMRVWHWPNVDVPRVAARIEWALGCVAESVCVDRCQHIGLLARNETWIVG